MPHRPSPTFRHWSGIAYRVSSYDVPLWVSPNRRHGRWNIADSVPTQYLSLDPEAPFAEILRHEDLRTDEAASHYRSTIWQVEIDQDAIVDYSTFELADRAQFESAALVSDDLERCQAEARWLMDMGARGILSPSAALPGSVNLTLFGPRVGVKWGAVPGLASALPVQAVSTGHPPKGLAARVHHIGQSEPLLEEYLKAK